MKQIYLFWFFLLCTHFSIAANHGNEFRVPLGCSEFPSCGDDITLSEIVQSYKKRKDFLKEFRRLPKTEIRKYEELTGHSTFDIAVAHDHNICRDTSTLGSYYFWAPHDEFPDGESALEEILMNVNSMKPVRSGILIEGVNSKSTERHIALCNVKRIGERQSVPKDCVTIAVLTKDKSFLRGGMINQACKIRGSLRSSGSIDIKFKIETNIEMAQFASNILSMLMGKIDLSSEQEVSKTKNGKIESAYITSTSGFRNSKVLKGWREIMDFDVYLHEYMERVSVRATARTLVSRQNLGSVVNYNGLNDIQKDVYLRYLNFALEQAIMKTCVKPRKVDSENIICD